MAAELIYASPSLTVLTAPPSPDHEPAHAADWCICSLEKAREHKKPAEAARRPCPLEKSLFQSVLTRAPKAVCLHQARRLVQRLAKGSWTIDLLLLLQHMPCALATSYTGYNPTHANKVSCGLLPSQDIFLKRHVAVGSQ